MLTVNQKPINENMLRLVVIDYAKLQVSDSLAFRLFGDMLCKRQESFLRTRDTFLVIDKHDLIGTHFLVYDTQELFSPKLVAGFRLTYDERAKAHGLEMPIESILSVCPAQARLDFQEFQKEKGPAIQVNTLFIDPQYSFSQSKLKLSDMLFFSVCAYIRRLGFDHYVCATNDRLKTDRWMKRAESYDNTYSFQHPEVHDPHTLFFGKSINKEWLKECFIKIGRAHV